MAAQDASPAVVEQELTYRGRRTAPGGKIVYDYQPAGHPSLWYSKAIVAGAQVGSIVTVTRPADDPKSVYTKGQYAPRVTGFAEVDEVELLRWQVADRAAYERKSQEDGVRRAAKRAGGLEPHLEALEAVARGLTSSERSAFARYVSDRVRGVS